MAFSEGAGDDTDMSDYTSAYECVNSAEGSEDAPVSGQGTDISSLPVKPGDVWTCTFTNTRKGGHVKLVKDIVPVNEQLGDPGKFDLNIDGEGAYDATKTDAGDGDFVERNVPNGNVTLSEAAGTDTELSDYTTTYSCANGADEQGEPLSGEGTSIEGLAVAQGDDWTCTLRNERKKGKVSVVKHLEPTTDAGLFDLSIDGPGAHDASASDQGHNGRVEVYVPEGTASVAETAGTGTAMSAYSSTYTCANFAEGNEDSPHNGSGTAVEGISVSAGDDWVCTFTNVRKPRIIVKKITDPAGDETTSFPFASNLPQTAGGEGGQAVAADGAFSLKDGEQVSTLAVPGQYSITEADAYQLGYRLKSATCETNGEDAQPQLLADGQQSDQDRTVVLHGGCRRHGHLHVRQREARRGARRRQDAEGAGGLHRPGRRVRVRGDQQRLAGPPRRDGQRRQVPRPGSAPGRQDRQRRRPARAR